MRLFIMRFIEWLGVEKLIEMHSRYRNDSEERQMYGFNSTLPRGWKTLYALYLDLGRGEKLSNAIIKSIKEKP